MLKTAQGRRMMCVDGNVYRIVGRVISNESYRWECIRRDIDCKARVHTQSLTGTGDHELLHILEDNRHTHSPYTPRKLTKLLQKHKIQILGMPEQATRPATGSFEQITLSPITSGNENSSKIVKNKLATERPAAKVQRSDNVAPASTDPFTPETYDDPLESLKERVSLSAPLSPSEYTFLPSAKGNRVICIQNFIYHFDSRSAKNGRSYWTCMLRRDKFYRCNARLTTTMTDKGPIIIKISGTHQHAECTKDIERRLKKVETESFNETLGNSDAGNHVQLQKSTQLIEQRIGAIKKQHSVPKLPAPKNLP